MSFKFISPASVENRPADETADTKESFFCSLPCELWVEILNHAWLSVMESAERRAFCSSMLLVSPQWHAVFSHVFIKNIYINSLTDLRHICKLWSLDEPSLIKYSSRPTLELRRNQLCTSITRQITRPRKCLEEPESKTILPSSSARHLLDTFRHVPCLPNLRTLSIVYHPSGASLPTCLPLTQTASIVHLQIEYDISPRTEPWVAEELGLAGGRWLHTDFPVAKLEHVSFHHCSTGNMRERMRQQADLGEFLQFNRHLRHARDKDDWLRLRIRGASRSLRRDAVVIHGALVPEYDINEVRRCLKADGSVELQRMNMPRTVRGTALGIVFDKFRYDRNRCPSDDESILDQWRDVRIFGY